MAVAADLVRTPTLLSLARVPLGLVFLGVADRPALALGVIGASAATDVLDGWTARRFHQESATGAVVDPLTDKWFVGCVIGALVVHGKLPPLGVVALLTRELAEIPLAMREMRRRAEGVPYVEHPTALRAGKIATALQFASIGAAVLGATVMRDGLLVATAIAGVAAGLSYWKRTLVVES
ncbi:MAG: CDP-alcohol phosphatidyltransferase family protein [Deltaproteobacteria bacterium]|nr:CDP-alcohol phosphatidyltransferase family protein [Deltaproteobacteria bacterium]